jgi:NADH-quinone oxidoreductase subunit H
MCLIYFERKFCAAIQCRVGPNRVGWKGLLQLVADVLKLMIKEKSTPLFSDKLLYFIAPIMSFSASFMLLLIVPFSPQIQVINLNIGILYWIAISSIGILGVLIGGWSSYNKWALLGAIRSASQMISYELSIILSLLVIAIFTGTLDLQKIVLSQTSGWWLWKDHFVTVIAFITFFIASIAELHRIPFDLPEGESELGAGFHTEYSGMQFAFFYLSEYLNLFIASAMIVTLFLGGWLPFHIYGFTWFNAYMNYIPSIIWFFSKVFLIIFIIMWIRWTLPRLRIDQLIELEWKYLLPMGLINIIFASISVLNNLYFLI